VFAAFLLGMSVNVLLTQTRSALVGAVFSLTGLPVFLFMRRWNAARKRPSGPDGI